MVIFQIVKLITKSLENKASHLIKPSFCLKLQAVGSIQINHQRISKALSVLDYLVLKSKNDHFGEKSLSIKNTHILDGVFWESLHNQESFSVITNNNLSKDKTPRSQILLQNFIDFCFVSFWLLILRRSQNLNLNFACFYTTQFCSWMLTECLPRLKMKNVPNICLHVSIYSLSLF